MSEKAQKYFEELKQNGLLMLRGFLNPVEVEQARQELERWFDLDLQERKSKKINEGAHIGVAGNTHLNQGKHVLVDVFTKSPTLDRLFDKMLTDSSLSHVVRNTVGENVKLRGYNVRKMTGNLSQSAMEWHRDNPGEISWAIILSESDPLVDASTAYVPGSHLFPTCPFKSSVMAMPYPDARSPAKISYFSQFLAQKTVKNAVDADGKPGDCYFFIGDVWHSRRPNFNGKKGMVFFAGAFPMEIPFPAHSKVNIPPESVLNQLSENVRKIVDFKNTPSNSDRSSYYYEMLERRQKKGWFTIWRAAELEKFLFEFNLNHIINSWRVYLFSYLKPFLKPILTKLKGSS